MEIVPPKIIELGIVPEGKSGPSTKKNGAIGAIVGMMVMCTIFIGIYMLDDSIKSEEDVEKYLGLVVLASLPDYRISKQKKRARNKNGK